MNTQEYHIKRNGIYQKLVEAKLIEDTDDNFQTLDTILGEELNVEWDDRGIIIVGCGSTIDAKALTAIKKLVDDNAPRQTLDDFKEPIMRISNYKVDDFLLTTPKYDGTSTSKFNKPNTKNWKK